MNSTSCLNGSEPFDIQIFIYLQALERQYSYFTIYVFVLGWWSNQQEEHGHICLYFVLVNYSPITEALGNSVIREHIRGEAYYWVETIVALFGLLKQCCACFEKNN